MSLALHVLVVEDDLMMSMMVEDELATLGCTSVVGSSLAEATRLAATERIDIGVLDVNITGEPVYPVADELRRRGIPFIFATAYVRCGVPEEYSSVPRLNKPFRLAELEDTLRTVANRLPAAR